MQRRQKGIPCTECACCVLLRK